MTDLSSWYRSPWYRSGAAPVPSSAQTELNRELKEAPLSSEWRWFFVPLIVLAIIDYFYLQHWG